MNLKQPWIIQAKELINYKYFIYTDKTNDGHIFYIGMGKIERLSKYSRNKYHKSISKEYGINRYIIYACNDYKQLKEMEVYFIRIYNTYWYENQDKKVCNFTKGGDGTVGLIFSEDHRRKISESNSGINNWNYGNKLPEYQKELISIANSGKNNAMYGRLEKDCPNYGKKMSNFTKEKIRKINSGKTHPNYGKHLSETTKEKLRISNTKIDNNMINKIIDLRKNYKKYDEINIITGISIKTISKILNKYIPDINKEIYLKIKNLK
jgi:hypothetical protein